jgi:hypothetical protein
MFLFWVGNRIISLPLISLDLVFDLGDQERGGGGGGEGRGGRLGHQTCYFDPLRSPGKPPLWWTSSITKIRGFLTDVIVVGFLVVTQDLVILCWDLHNYKSYDNKILRFK